MREIKFRAWDKQFSKMIDIRLPEKYHIDWERFELMQYTGLKDKNGVEIYEGDIVRPKEHSNYVVRWYNEDEGEVSTYGYYMEVTGMPDVIVSLNPVQARKLEVIGNIYENPELLEGKK